MNDGGISDRVRSSSSGRAEESKSIVNKLEAYKVRFPIPQDRLSHPLYRKFVKVFLTSKGGNSDKCNVISGLDVIHITRKWGRVPTEGYMDQTPKPDVVPVDINLWLSNP